MKRWFHHKYRVDTWRAPWWDYRDPGLYFVTACTRDRAPFFGAIHRGRVRLTPAGRILEDEWHRTEFVRPNVRLDAFVIMPNHFHGVLEILYRLPAQEANLRPAMGKPQRLLAGSLGSIVGQIKSQTTKRIWGAGVPDFAWQQRFYDRIVRSDEAIDRVRRYIHNNPARWASDRFHVTTENDVARGERPVRRRRG